MAILISQDPSVEALTPSEQVLYNRYAGWERSLLTSGDPTGIPEYRTGLFCKMPGATPAPPAPPPPAPPMGPAGPPLAPQVPVNPPAPQPMGPPQVPQPRGPPIRDPSRGRMPRRKRTVEPSDRRTRSSGPVEEPPPLPTRTRKAPSPAPTPTTPRIEPEPEGDPGEGTSLMGRLTNLGRSFLFGGGDDPDGGDPPAGVNSTMNQPGSLGGPSGPDSGSRDPPEDPEPDWDSCLF